MRLDRPFAKLPVRFCAETLAAEIAGLPQEAWVAHPDATPGNDAVMLVSAGGQIDHGRSGAMAATPYLEALPYARQIMQHLGCVWSRSRLMGLAAKAQVVPHVDAHYHWRSHWRLHIPIVTNPGVRFTCGEESVHMQPGECWMFDSFRPHHVQNDGDAKRIHLVLDTVGGGQLFNLLEAAQTPGGEKQEADLIAPDGHTDHHPRIEQHNAPGVMSPWEIRHHVDFLLGHCPPATEVSAIARRLDGFVDAWTAEWAAAGDDPGHGATYLALVTSARNDLAALGADTIRLDNGVPLLHCLRQIVFLMAVDRERLAESVKASARGAQ
jgi:hypothetical protein